MKILVIRLSSLGDVLLATPVLRALKNKFPHSEIHFIVKPQFADALRFNPNITRLMEYNSNSSGELKKYIADEGFAFIVDLQNNFRSRKLTAGFPNKIYRYAKPFIKKWLIVNTKINFFNPVKSVTQMYANAIPDLRLDSKGLDLFINEDINPQLHEGIDYIGICPGSQHFTKRWPEEYFIELGNRLSRMGFKVVCFGGKDDKILCRQISDGIKGSVNLQTENDLFSLAAGMKKCKVIVSNDSGLMHTAAAIGVPIVAIFGSSVMEFGFSPYGVKNLILENNSLNCRPCSHIGKNRCPKKHFKCMKDILPGDVIEKINSLLSAL